MRKNIIKYIYIKEHSHNSGIKFKYKENNCFNKYLLLWCMIAIEVFFSLKCNHFVRYLINNENICKKSLT